MKGKGCDQIALGDRDACYQTKDTPPTPIVVLLGVVLLGALTVGFLVLHNGALAP